MDMVFLRADAHAMGRVIAEAMLGQGTDTAEVLNLAQPPAGVAPLQQRLWKELLIQSIQRQLRIHNVTV